MSETVKAKVSKAATVLAYTEKDIIAIEALKAANGVHKSLAELGIPAASIVSLQNKAKKFPNEAVQIASEEVETVCSECGAKRKFKLYWIA